MMSMTSTGFFREVSNNLNNIGGGILFLNNSEYFAHTNVYQIATQ